MKAAILVETGKPLVIAEVEAPQRLEYGQVLVRVHASGICGSQIGEIDGVKGPDKFLPHLLGHEGGGVVEEIGPGVKYVKQGDRVVLHWRKGAGIEAPTPKYAWDGCVVNAGWVTTFNELAVISENRVTRIDDDVPFEIAALLGCAVTTGLGVVTNDARVRIGESIAVYGVGGVGLCVVQGAALAGAWPIIAIDRDAAKLAMAIQFGATHTLNTTGTLNTVDPVGMTGMTGTLSMAGTAGTINTEQATPATQEKPFHQVAQSFLPVRTGTEACPTGLTSSQTTQMLQRNTIVNMAGTVGTASTVNTVNMVGAGTAAAIRAIAGSGGVDVAVDTTGHVPLIEEAYEVTSPRGRTVLVGVPRAGEKARLYTLPLYFGKTLQGSHGGQAEPATDIPRYVNIWRQGRLRLQEMITHTLPLEEINEAIALLRTGRAGRCVIRMNR